MRFGRAIVDTGHDSLGNRVLWTALPPLLYRTAEGATLTALGPDDVAVSVMAVVPGRGGPQWWRLVAGDPQNVGEASYED